MEIKTFYFNPIRTCCYVAWDETKECVIVDPGCNGQREFQRIVDFISLKELKPVKVLLTLVRVHESNEVFRIIKDIDPNAFVSQTGVRGVFGKGFDTVLNRREQARAQEMEVLELEQERREHAAEEFAD